MKIREDNIEEGYFYHIYNRGINGSDVFFTTENYRFFLQQAKKFLLQSFECYAYCLMSNHFHLVLRAKELHSFHDESGFRHDAGLHSENGLYSKQIGRLISSYTQSVNKVCSRHGALFESPFKRIRISDEGYLRNLIIYVHQNPLAIGTAIEDYPHSSYKAILDIRDTALQRDDVLELFGGPDNFKECHKRLVEFR